MPVFVPILKEKGLLDNIEITLGIVGSRKIYEKDDYGASVWNIFTPNLIIYGFDADPDACEAAEAKLAAEQINWKEKHIPLALSKSIGEANLYVTKGLDCTSLYPPNESFVKRFRIFKRSFELDFTVTLETTTLDAFCQEEDIQNIDFLQIDVQGADLDVLQGASELLKRSVLGIEIEVEFSPLYINQPLFSDIDIYLRKEGFSLFDLDSHHPACRLSRDCSPIYSTVRQGQLLWADAFYLRDPIMHSNSRANQEPEQILKLACIADVLDFPDYALELLEYLTLNYGESPKYNFAQIIIETLSQFPALVEQGLDSLPIVANLRPYL